jgi:hypothetical protein
MRGRVSLVAMVALAGPALAQSQTPLTSPGVTLPAPLASPSAPPLAARSTLSLQAIFAGGQKPIRSGMTWRIYEDRGDDVAPTFVQRTDEPSPTVVLPQGTYVIHASYGFASAVRRITLRGAALSERLTISAGALRLNGAIGDQPLPAARLAFSVFVPIGTNSEGRLVIGGAKAGDLIRLPEGTYHVVSTYGDSNAIMRADLKVEGGQVTDATLNHRAATVTLKLVGAAGGEAFAGTAFSVLTPGGDVIREAIGAFPSVTLAEGEYVLIARHDGQVYTREFKVESGLDRDIEILAKSS